MIYGKNCKLKPKRLIDILYPLVLVGLIFNLYTNYIYNRIFIYADIRICDAGWFAQMMYESSWLVDNPKVISEWYRPGDISFYTSHFSPIFYIFSIIRKGISLVYDVNVVQYFAWFQGACHSIIAFLYFNLIKNILPKNNLGNFYAFFLAALFSINHLFANIISYPHYEIAGVTFLIMCLYCLTKEWNIFGLLFLLLACSVREDMGIHSAAILGLWFLYEWWKWKRFNRTLFFFSIVAILSFIVALYVKTKFPSAGHNLMGIYVGNTLADNLRIDLAWQRIHMFFTRNSFISWPLLAILLMSWRQKNWFLALGVFSCIPWFIVNIFAASPHAGNFGTYVAYPFATAFIWPLLAMGYMINMKKETYTKNYKNWIILLQVLILLTTSLTARKKVYGPFCQWVSQEVRSDCNTLFKNINLLDDLGDYKISEAVMLLHPNAFKTSQDFSLRNVEETSGFLPENSVVFCPGFLWQVDLYLTQHKPYYYQFLNTRIRISTDKPIEQMPNLGPYLKPANVLLDQAQTLKGTRVSPSQIKLQGQENQVVFKTMPMKLPKGKFILSLPIEGSQLSTIGIIKIINEKGKQIIQSCEISTKNYKCHFSLEDITNVIIQLQSSTRTPIIINNPTLVMD